MAFGYCAWCSRELPNTSDASAFLARSGSLCESCAEGIGAMLSELSGSSYGFTRINLEFEWQFFFDLLTKHATYNQDTRTLDVNLSIPLCKVIEHLPRLGPENSQDTPGHPN